MMRPLLAHACPGFAAIRGSGKELSQLARHWFRPSTPVGIPGSRVIESAKLDPRDLGQHLLECVERYLEVRGALAPTLQEDLCANGFERFHLAAHLDRELRVGV